MEWKDALLTKNYSPDYRKQLIAKLTLIFEKHTYTFPELLEVLTKKKDLINSSERTIKLVRSILNHCEDKELLTDQQLAILRKKLKNKGSDPDNYVPTDQEVQTTLSKLSANSRLVYLVYLVSGIRKVEGKYLLQNLDKLMVQEKEGFVKISMNYLRHNKNSYFCYLPLEVYKKLKTTNQLSVSSLENELKRHKLIPVKYCRKWFYIKCIELGIPDIIADYYQGRSANSVGSNHYLSRQMLADQNYGKIIGYLNSLLVYIYCNT